MGEKKINNYQPLISIITPVHNGERFFVDTMNTVCSQTYQNWEWIIVDDASTDNTLRTIEKTRSKLSKDGKLSGKITVVKLEKNSGAAKARNKGIEIAKGEYLCFLDADDLWQSDKLARQIEFMKKKNCAFSYHSYEFANGKGEPNGKKVIAKEELRYRQALKDNKISTITVMFDLKKIDKRLVEMPDLQYVEDTALWWSILRNGFVAYGIPDLYAFYRRSLNTSSSNKLGTQKPLWNLYRKIEKLGVLDSIYCLSCKNFHAVLRRI